MRRTATFLILLLSIIISAPFLCFCAVWGCLGTNLRRLRKKQPRLTWVGNSTLSQALTSKALRIHGYNSQALCFQSNQNETARYYDRILVTPSGAPRGLKSLHQQLRFYGQFCRTLVSADILHSFFDGGILKLTLLEKFEFRFWTLLGKRLVLLPYGSDSFVYSALPDVEVYRRLKQLYPKTAQADAKTQENIARYSQIAHCVVGCVGHTLCLDRVDVWPVVWYPYPDYTDGVIDDIETALQSGTIHIVQASNHGGLKGTQYAEAAILALQAEGYAITFERVTSRTHADVMTIISKADIVIDQLYVGYALGAIEAAALGKPVITALNYPPAHAPFREKSYFSFCPFIDADIHTIEIQLRALLDNRAELFSIGRACRAYVERYHSPEACAALFTHIYDSIWFNKSTDLSALYRP